jgi:hypothetical protein
MTVAEDCSYVFLVGSFVSLVGSSGRAGCSVTNAGPDCCNSSYPEGSGLNCQMLERFITRCTHKQCSQPPKSLSHHPTALLHMCQPLSAALLKGGLHQMPVCPPDVCLKPPSCYNIQQHTVTQPLKSLNTKPTALSCGSHSVSALMGGLPQMPVCPPAL